MGWKKERRPKQSISSVTSISFLTNPNLTFHRFSDGTISNDGKKMTREGSVDGALWTTNASMDYGKANLSIPINENEKSTTNILSTTYETPEDDATSKRYSVYSSNCNNSTVGTLPHTTHNGSTMKLIQVQKDDSSDSKQSRCSIFRGTILCLCMNLTYANIVRFPRELERHGFAFLVPYLTLMFIIGVPVVLLEMALGQFLGQGSAHSWKASPFFKGASMLGRFASWLGTIWISMQMSLALLYIGQMSFSSVPFKQCPSKVYQNLKENKYEELPTTGQLCLEKTFLRPVWEYSLSFGLLAIGLVLLWVIIMMCTHSSRINRRSLLMFGFVTMGVLIFQTGWHVTNTIQSGLLPKIWPFRSDMLIQSSTWFYALIQVMFSTQIGVGAIPVMTGKFLYKGDAIRTCAVYMCFNFLVTIVATAYYMTTFGQHNSSSHHKMPFPDLTTITSIYDRAFIEEEHTYLRSLIPSLAYLMIICAGLTSISIAIYTSSRLLKRHPNFVMCLVAMFNAIACLLCPNYIISRMLDMRWVGVLIICALVFDLISIVWVYGIKDLAVDLEFSVGRRIMKVWLLLWILIPLMLVGIIAWWIAMPSTLSYDPIIDMMPRWILLIISFVIILLFAGHEASKQVDYNTCNMILESTRASKDWGPADPLVRHAWKQWKSVCDDTGQRDFTLKRRGTKDWTNSIKKGQYSHASNKNKYVVNGKVEPTTITGGSNSPNYSGSVFGDSAIEEDMNSERYASNHLGAFASHESRKSSTQRSSNASQQSFMYHQQQYEFEPEDESDITNNYHCQKIPIRISNQVQRQNNYLSTIEVIPPTTHTIQSTFMPKNPLTYHEHDEDFTGAFHDNFRHNQMQNNDIENGRIQIGNGDTQLVHNIMINDCSEGSGSTKTTNTATTNGQRELYNWRRLPRDPNEFSTEL